MRLFVLLVLIGCRNKPDTTPDPTIVTPLVSVSAPAPAPAPSAAQVAIVDAARSQPDAGKLGEYVLDTADGYNISTPPRSSACVIFVWSANCKKCEAMLRTAHDLAKLHPSGIEYISVSLDDEKAWRAVVGYGKFVTDARDRKLAAHYGLTEGSILVARKDKQIVWIGDWTETSEADLEQRIRALE